MFGIGFEKLLTLAILAAILIGPDKLPKVAVDAAKLIQRIRGFSKEAMTEFKSQLGPEFANLQIEDLNPKTFINKHLEDVVTETKKIAKVTSADLAKIKEQTKIDPDLL